MSRRQKLIDRFLEQPTDFTWNEMSRLLEGFGYQKIEGNGSRCCFEMKNVDRIRLHKPHPDPTVKSYVMKQVLEKLKDQKLL